MKITLNKKYLDGSLQGMLELKRPFRCSYVPKDEGYVEMGERGLPEYILTYSELPIPEDNREDNANALFRIPHKLDVKNNEEMWLKFPKATVILITREADDKFRKENKDLIERIEALYIE